MPRVVERYKPQIAEAAHRAVCGFTGESGVGRCVLYALAAKAILQLLDPGERWLLQCGTLHLVCDPPHAITFDASDGGFERMEYHAWLARRVLVPEGEQVEIVDLSARHHKQVALQSVGRRLVAAGPSFMTFEREPEDAKIEWRIADPPEYLWVRGDQLDWAWYVPVREATLSLLKSLANQRDTVSTIGALAIGHLGDILDG